MEPTRRFLGPPPNTAAALIGLVLTLLAAVGLSIGYTAHMQHVSDQQWCEVLRSLDAPLPASPAPSARQREIAVHLHELRVRKGC